MSNRIFNQKQRRELLANKHVSACSEKSTMYAKEFKVRAVKEYEQGLSPRDIFTKAGFNINTIGSKTPRECLKRWNNKYRAQGIHALREEKRGRKRGSPTSPPEKDTIERLQLEIEYLKAENVFLAQLRAGKK